MILLTSHSIKQIIKVSLALLVLGILACNLSTDKTNKAKSSESDCSQFPAKHVIYQIGKSIIDKHDNDQIWNLSEIDTTEFFTTVDHFIDTKEKTRLVLLGGTAGMSSGSADNLLLLFSCTNINKVIWSGQIGDFTQSDIQDLNADGIKEIVSNARGHYMGECDEKYNIFNFQGGQQHILFSARSNSVLECGKDNLSEIYEQGDTLELNLDCTLIKLRNKEYTVRQVRTLKIHSGGRTEKEMMRRLKVQIDTLYIDLK